MKHEYSQDVNNLIAKCSACGENFDFDKAEINHAQIVTDYRSKTGVADRYYLNCPICCEDIVLHVYVSLA